MVSAVADATTRFAKGFDNPSVYCDVLYPLITYIRDDLRMVTPVRMWTTPVSAG